ncbi:MAG: TonB-dependent receptor [Bacteroidales bacterium]
MKPEKLFLTAGFAILFCLPSLAQSLQLINAGDHAPVPYVAVFNQQKNRSTLSDSLGTIDLRLFKAEDTLEFQHPSYLSRKMPWSGLKGKQNLTLYRRNVLLDEFVISASKSRESTMEIPARVDVLAGDAIRHSGGFNSAEILEATGNILVQKSQGGGGSPILRGMEANKILLVVDGVRMNNAIYRNGHLHNAITIDQAVLDRAEILYGPSSVMYGSDALGGVIHYFTREPVLSPEGQGPAFHIGGSAGYSTAERGIQSHLDVSLGGRRFGSLSSVTFKRLGDVRSGGNRAPFLGDWGLIPHYADRTFQRDSMVANPDPRVQKYTDYWQTDLMQKFLFVPSPKVELGLNLQYSTSSYVHRLDMLNDYSDGRLKYAEYFYGPQNRFLASLKNTVKANGFLFTRLTSILSYQRIDEDRYSRKMDATQRLVQQEDVEVFSFTGDFIKIWNPEHKLNYGTEVNHNLVASDAWYFDTGTGALSDAQTRYPEGGSQTWNASFYASYKWILNPRVLLNGGLRYSRALLLSRFDNPCIPWIPSPSGTGP